MEIHIFVDASEHAYDALVYFLYKHEAQYFSILNTRDFKNKGPQKPHTNPLKIRTDENSN